MIETALEFFGKQYFWTVGKFKKICIKICGKNMDTLMKTERQGNFKRVVY